MCAARGISRRRILCLAARVVSREHGVPLGCNPYLNIGNSNEDSPTEKRVEGTLNTTQLGS